MMDQNVFRELLMGSAFSRFRLAGIPEVEKCVNLLLHPGDC